MLRAQLEEKSSTADIVRQFGRLAAIFGDSKIKTEAQQEILLREWLEAIVCSPAHLHEAVSATIRKSEFWPTPAQILSEVVALRMDAQGEYDRLTGHGYHKSDSDPELTAAEIAAREEIIKKIKAAVGYKPDHGSSHTDKPDEPRPSTPASRDMTVGDDLRNSCTARRARHEPTCEPACSRHRSSSNCLLRAERYKIAAPKGS